MNNIISDAKFQIERLRAQMLHRRRVKSRGSRRDHGKCNQRGGERIRPNIGSFQTLYLCCQRFHTRLRDVRVGDCGLRNMRLFNLQVSSSQFGSYAQMGQYCYQHMDMIRTTFCFYELHSLAFAQFSQYLSYISL